MDHTEFALCFNLFSHYFGIMFAFFHGFTTSELYSRATLRPSPNINDHGHISSWVMRAPITTKIASNVAYRKQIAADAAEESTQHSCWLYYVRIMFRSSLVSNFGIRTTLVSCASVVVGSLLSTELSSWSARNCWCWIPPYDTAGAAVTTAVTAAAGSTMRDNRVVLQGSKSVPPSTSAGLDISLTFLTFLWFFFEKRCFSYLLF